MTEHPTITLPAFSEVLGETLTLHAPEDWHERIRALGPYLVYGDNYRRKVVDLLRDMDHRVRNGYLIGYDSLLSAELIVETGARS